MFETASGLQAFNPLQIDAVGEFVVVQVERFFGSFQRGERRHSVVYSVEFVDRTTVVVIQQIKLRAVAVNIFVWSVELDGFNGLCQFIVLGGEACEIHHIGNSLLFGAFHQQLAQSVECVLWVALELVFSNGLQDGPGHASCDRPIVCVKAVGVDEHILSNVCSKGTDNAAEHIGTFRVGGSFLHDVVDVLEGKSVLNAQVLVVVNRVDGQRLHDGIVFHLLHNQVHPLGRL